MHRIDGRTVVITGGTSGLGLQTARALAPLGARLCLVGRDRDRTEHVAASVGGDVRALVGDLSS